jgi:hypothetical protein
VPITSQEGEPVQLPLPIEQIEADHPKREIIDYDPSSSSSTYVHVIENETIENLIAQHRGESHQDSPNESNDPQPIHSNQTPAEDL